MSWAKLSNRFNYHIVAAPLGDSIYIKLNINCLLLNLYYLDYIRIKFINIEVIMTYKRFFFFIKLWFHLTSKDFLGIYCAFFFLVYIILTITFTIIFIIKDCSNKIIFK